MIHRIKSAIRENLVAWLALFVALGGTSLAVSHYTITSTKQIKPSVLKQLRGKTGRAGNNGIAGPTGPTGPQGSAGVKGETGAGGRAGASAGLSDFNNGPVTLEENIVEQIVANMKSVPPGSYILNAKVTLEDNDELEPSGTTVSCYLRAETDFDQASAHLAKYPEPGNVETLALTLSHTFATTNPVTLSCNDFKHGHSFIAAIHAEISAVQVQTLTRTSG